MEQLRKIAKTLLRPLPDEGRALKTSVRWTLMQKELIASKLRQRISGTVLPDPRLVYHIDPRRIEFATSLDNGSSDWEDWVLPKKGGSAKRVQGGNWDILRHRVADMRIVRAVRDRIHHGVSWTSTDFYQVAIGQIESGRTLWSCAKAADFSRHCDRVDRLIESIVHKGYQTYSENLATPHYDTATGQSEVLINLNREGLPLFQDGRHRLAIALALGLSSIPVQIFVRHTEWQSFRMYLLQMAESKNPGAATTGFLYQPAVHFDLLSIPHSKDSEARWKAIARHLSETNPGKAIDIGCNLGYMCHKLEQAGYDVTGIEYLPEVAYAARKIALAERRSFNVIHGDILSDEVLVRTGSHFDVVVALSVFHHFIKTEAGFQKLRNLLARIQTKCLYFEPHHHSESQMCGKYANPSPEEFVKLVSDWTGLTNVSALYNGNDGRTIFALQS